MAGGGVSDPKHTERKTGPGALYREKFWGSKKKKANSGEWLGRGWGGGGVGVT